jgi:DNA polymerase-1
MATKLLQTYTTREGIYNNLEEVKNKFGNSVFNKLKQGEKLSELSYRLATIDRQAPIKLSLPECEIHDYDKSKAVALFEALDFKSLINKLPNDLFEQMVEEEIF